MLKATVTAYLISTSAHAGDAIESYFFIIGAAPSAVPTQHQADYTTQAFRSYLSELSAKWSAACSADVFAWPTNLISNNQPSWQPDMWVGILAMEPTEEALMAALPEASPCLESGYSASGVIVFPSAYQYCAMGDDGSESWAETCN